MKMDCPLHSLNAGPTSRMLVFQPNYFSVVLVLVCWISCPFAIVDTSLFASQLMFSFHLKHFVFQPLQPLCSFSFWLFFCLILFSCFPACSSISSILFFFCHSLSVSFTFSLLLLLRHVMKCVHLFNSICWKGLTLSIPSESGVFQSKKIPQYVPTWFF